MRVHVYEPGAGVARSEEAAPETRLGDLLVLEDGERVYPIEEDVALDANLTMEAALGAGPGHLVVSACRKIVVTVSYGGSDRQVRVNPSARLRRVRKLAISEFGIPAHDAADLVFRLPGGAQDLDLASPVGSVVPRGICSVVVDLAHATRPQG